MKLKPNLGTAFLIFSVSLLAIDDKKIPNDADRPPGAAIIDKIRDTVTHFSDEEQELALLEIAEALNAVDPSQVERVSLESFYLARKNLQPGPFQASVEKNALTSLALVNPARAAALYTLQDPPNEDPKVSEDRRSYGARVLFARLWAAQGPSALVQIQSLATWLGETGQYPYPAVSPIIQKVFPADPSKAQELFQDAVSALGKDPGFIGTNRQFVLFILDTHNFVPQPVLRNAIEQALVAIKKGSERQKASRRIQMTSKRGTYSFDSEANYLIYRLLPLIREIGADWAGDVLEKYPSVRGIPEAPLNSTVTTASAVSFDATPAPGAMQSALDENRLTQLAALAQSDPQAALQSVGLIADPGLRAVALAMLQRDSAPASGSESDLQKKLDSMPNNVTKLRLLVALGCRTRQGEDAQVRRYASQAVDFGTELFNQDLRSNPGKLSYLGNGYDPLVSLAGCYGSDSPDRNWMEAEIGKSGNELLQAHMLIALAKAAALAKPSGVNLSSKQ
jgi:hypothetical protein